MTFPTHADILTQHRPYGLDCACGRPINSDADWARHVDQVWREACMVRAVDELLGLPAGAVIHSGADGAIEQFADGHWYVPGRRDAISFRRVLEAIPALLIHHPDWSDQ